MLEPKEGQERCMIHRGAKAAWDDHIKDAGRVHMTKTQYHTALAMGDQVRALLGDARKLDEYLAIKNAGTDRACGRCGHYEFEHGPGEVDEENAGVAKVQGTGCQHYMGMGEACECYPFVEVN